MGYLRRHTIAVTGTYGDYIDKAHAFAQGTGAQVTDILKASINQERTFYVLPDGSKEGWSESIEGDRRREKIIEYLKSLAYDDGSSPVVWVELYYGDELGQAEILNHN